MLRFRFLLSLIFVCSWLLLSTSAVQAKSGENSQTYAHYMMGVFLDNLDQTEEALKEFEQARRFDPDSDSIALRIAIDYIKLGHTTEGIEQLNKILAVNPENLGARTILALIYTSKNQLDLAQNQYEIILKKASEQEPDNLDIHNYLGQLYFQKKNFDKALEQFRSILKSDPKYIEAKLFIGLIYDEQEKRLEAIKEFKEILEISPDNADALNALGYIYAEMNQNLDEAEKLISRALEQQPKNGAYVDSLGWVYFKKGQLKEAREKIEQAANMLEDPVIFDHLGDIYSALGDQAKAKEIWQKVLESKELDKKIRNTIQEKINRKTAE
jgi:tetratricopeptide (TPR) repeat protein